MIIVVLINNHQLKKNKNDNANDISYIEGYYGITNLYKFYIPNSWTYGENNDNIALTNSEVSMIVYNYVDGHLDSINTNVLLNEYANNGYNSATSEESILNNHKIYYIKYSVGGIYFADFYYQYDSEKIIYGQISSLQNDNLISEDIKNIIISLNINNEKNISITKTPIDYDSILNLFK